MKKKSLTLLFIISILCSTVSAVDNFPRWGVGIKAASFGVPNALADSFVYEHPTISGSSFAFEWVSYGIKGPRSGLFTLFSLEYSRMGGQGYWRKEEGDRQQDLEGEITQLNMTVTLLANIFPSWVVHPYIGFGLGVGRVAYWAEGVYVDDNPLTAIKDTYVDNMILPVIHLPVGFAINISDRVMIRLEGGFKNGLYFGGSVVYNL